MRIYETEWCHFFLYEISEDVQKGEVKDWLNLRRGEFISDIDYTYFSNYVKQGSDYFFEYWNSNKNENVFNQIPIGLQVDDDKIKLIQKDS